MKHSRILSSGIVLLFLIMFHAAGVMAQNSTYDNNGKIKSVEQRRYEESERNRTKVTTPSRPATRYESDPVNNAATKKSTTNSAAYIVKVNNEYGFVAKGGGKSMTMYEDIVHENFFGEFGLYGVKQNGKWGFISETGATVIAFQYDAVLARFNYNGTTGMYSEEGYKNVVAKVIMDNHTYTIGRYGNTIGTPVPYVADPNIKIAGPGLNYISEPKRVYDKIERFYEGMAVVSIGYNFGYIDTSFKEVVPLVYDYASDFKEGFAVVKRREKYGIITKEGKIVIPLMYEKSAYFVTNGYAAVQLNGKWGFVNMENKTIVPFLYEEATFFFENRAAVKLDGRWGYVDNKGKVIVPIKYSRASRFGGGYAAVQLNFGWGFIDLNGVELIPPIYNDVYNYKDGKAKVVLYGRTIFVDSTGKEVSE